MGATGHFGSGSPASCSSRCHIGMYGASDFPRAVEGLGQLGHDDHAPRHDNIDDEPSVFLCDDRSVPE
jgi:hypothetical protein